MQKEAEESVYMSLGSNSLSSGKDQSEPSSLHSSELSIELQRVPSIVWTEEAASWRSKRPADQLRPRNRAATLISIVAIVLVCVVWRCFLQLGAGRWRVAAGRSLAAGGEEGEGVFGCKYTGAEEAHGSQTSGAVFGREKRALLLRASSVISSFGCLVHYAGKSVFRLPMLEQHKAASLLLGMIIVELAALTALVGEPLEATLDCVFSIVDQALARVSNTVYRARIRNSNTKYNRLRMVIRRLRDTRHPTTAAPEAERLKGLRQLLLLQELGQLQMRAAFESVGKAISPSGKLNTQLLETALSVISHTSHVRKNQVMREPKLREWLVANETQWARSCLLPRSYLKVVLRLQQPVFKELIVELSDPSLTFAGASVKYSELAKRAEEHRNMFQGEELDSLSGDEELEEWTPHESSSPPASSTASPSKPTPPPPSFPAKRRGSSPAGWPSPSAEKKLEADDERTRNTCACYHSDSHSKGDRGEWMAKALVVPSPISMPNSFRRPERQQPSTSSKEIQEIFNETGEKLLKTTDKWNRTRAFDPAAGRQQQVLTDSRSLAPPELQAAPGAHRDSQPVYRGVAEGEPQGVQTLGGAVAAGGSSPFGWGLRTGLPFIQQLLRRTGGGLPGP
ncbi:hypothetical protein, conserved [Eimeria praecox]|uniref:Uncharacterized protein n=1 Tax=Eimeria praecox TaxID=51316 RepID=U6G7F5_9EIME|nr:hypothetical protein, conserved [Eimeria praecox]